jgi:hypothetical protein
MWATNNHRVSPRRNWESALLRAALSPAPPDSAQVGPLGALWRRVAGRPLFSGSAEWRAGRARHGQCFPSLYVESPSADRVTSSTAARQCSLDFRNLRSMPLVLLLPSDAPQPVSTRDSAPTPLLALPHRGGFNDPARCIARHRRQRALAVGDELPRRPVRSKSLNHRAARYCGNPGSNHHFASAVPVCPCRAAYRGRGSRSAGLHSV